jgi:hypothetical protein
MANEQTTGAPLTAPIAEQLREKEHLEQERAEERRAAEAQQARVERSKAEERDAAQRHAERPGRRAGRAHATWPVLVGGLVLFAVGALVARLLRRR